VGSPGRTWVVRRTVGYPTPVAHVCAIHLSPVKSLGLAACERATITAQGIPGDRAFVVLDERDQVATLRRYGRLAQASSRFDPQSGRLALLMPGDVVVEDTVSGGSQHMVQLFGRDLHGAVVDGPWADALSQLVGRPVRLMRVAEDASAQDAHAMSLLSRESLQELADRTGLDHAPDPRRFRNTLLIEGGRPHGEDDWVGQEVRAGEAVLRIAERDARCSLTTRNPDSGHRDLDTLRLIQSYRPATEGQICFGVYADVVSPGSVAVGDTVEPI
jgi:uncharacterized protein